MPKKATKSSNERELSRMLSLVHSDVLGSCSEEYLTELAGLLRDARWNVIGELCRRVRTPSHQPDSTESTP